MAHDKPWLNGADLLGEKIENVGAGAADLDGVNLLQVKNLIAANQNRKAAVIDIVDNTAVPPTENDGDRYIIDNTGGSNPAWDGAAANDIVQFNGTSGLWEATTPEEGCVVYVDNQDADAVFVNDGTPQWELRTPTGSKIYVVDDQTAAEALTELKVGDGIFVKNETPDIQPSFQVVTAITDGLYTTSTLRWVAYAASGVAVKNEGTANLTTTFTGNNTNTPLRVRTTLPGIGLLQKVNMDGALVGNCYCIQIDDPRGTDLSSGQPVTIYNFIATFSVRRTGGNSTFEFRMFLKRGASPISYLVDSVRENVDTDIETITISRKLTLIDGDIVGIGVERTSGNGSLVCERYTLSAQYAAQQGYR